MGLVTLAPGPVEVPVQVHTHALPALQPRLPRPYRAVLPPEAVLQVPSLPWEEMTGAGGEEGGTLRWDQVKAYPSGLRTGRMNQGTSNSGPAFPAAIPANTCTVLLYVHIRLYATVHCTTQLVCYRSFEYIVWNLSPGSPSHGNIDHVRIHTRGLFNPLCVGIGRVECADARISFISLRTTCPARYLQAQPHSRLR